MGGMGSGDRYRWRSKSTTSSVRRLDVRELQRGGALVPGADCGRFWSDGGRIGIRVAHVADQGRALLLALNYRVRLGDGSWEEIHEFVRLAWTPCHYGGWRPWFRCPLIVNGAYCGRRAAILYGAGRYFACRRCHDLAYPSTRATGPDRALHKARAIRLRLGGSANMLDAFPPKPPRLHWATYGRLRREAHAAELVYLADLSAWLDKTNAWIARHSTDPPGGSGPS